MFPTSHSNRQAARQLGSDRCVSRSQDAKSIVSGPMRALLAVLTVLGLVLASTAAAAEATAGVRLQGGCRAVPSSHSKPFTGFYVNTPSFLLLPSSFKCFNLQPTDLAAAPHLSRVTTTSTDLTPRAMTRTHLTSMVSVLPPTPPGTASQLAQQLIHPSRLLLPACCVQATTGMATTEMGTKTAGTCMATTSK